MVLVQASWQGKGRALVWRLENGRVCEFGMRVGTGYAGREVRGQFGGMTAWRGELGLLPGGGLNKMTLGTAGCAVASVG